MTNSTFQLMLSVNLEQREQIRNDGTYGEWLVQVKSSIFYIRSATNLLLIRT